MENNTRLWLSTINGGIFTALLGAWCSPLGGSFTGRRTGEVRWPTSARFDFECARGWNIKAGVCRQCCGRPTLTA